MDYSKLDDAILISLIVRQNAEALSVLYDRYSRLVFSLAFHSVGDHASAEEITQDVFFQIWQKANTYRIEQAKVSTWITSIARNRSIDILRRRMVRPESNSLGWDDLLPHLQPVSNLDPEETAQQSLQAQQMQVAIAALPPEQQLAISLAYFQGMTHSEIAQALDEPLGTVKTRIRLGMQKLRELLGPG